MAGVSSIWQNMCGSHFTLGFKYEPFGNILEVAYDIIMT